MRKQTLFYVLALVILVLAACGPQPTETPVPTDTPEPSNTPPPSNTPAPTVDPAELSVDDLQATVEAIETELAIAEQHLDSASGGNEAQYQTEVTTLTEELEEAQTWLEEAQAREGGEEAEDAEDAEDAEATEEAEEAEDAEATEEVEDAEDAEDAEEAEDAEATEAALTLVGDFEEAREWTWTELEEMEMITASVTLPKDEEEADFSGVGLAAFLEAAGLGEDAETLVATAADDFSSEIAIAEVKDCENCMIVLEEGALRLVMPDFSSKAWVKNLTSLEAK